MRARDVRAHTLYIARRLPGVSPSLWPCPSMVCDPRTWTTNSVWCKGKRHLRVPGMDQLGSTTAHVTWAELDRRLREAGLGRRAPGRVRARTEVVPNPNSSLKVVALLDGGLRPLTYWRLPPHRVSPPDPRPSTSAKSGRSHSQGLVGYSYHSNIGGQHLRTSHSVLHQGVRMGKFQSSLSALTMSWVAPVTAGRTSVRPAVQTTVRWGTPRTSGCPCSCVAAGCRRCLRP